MRNDYLDPEYARLAFEARQLWRELERASGQRLLVDCGCLNLAKASVTPDLDQNYAVQSYAVLEQLQPAPRGLLPVPLAERFPQFDADGGWLDVDAGFADLAAVTGCCARACGPAASTLAENTEPQAITRSGRTWQVPPAAGPVESDVLVITAGLGTNELLELLPGLLGPVPAAARPPVAVQVLHPRRGVTPLFTEAAMPVFAYLDIGIYGHPIYDGKTPGVKIGFYNPPDVARAPSRIGSVEDFVAECMPGLRGAEVVDVAAASGVDTCLYDLVEDDEFILGAGARRGGRLHRRRLARHRVQVRALGRPGAGPARRAARHGLRHRPLHARPVRRRRASHQGGVMTASI